MDTAVIYYSMSGNTRQTAELISRQTDSDIIRIEPEKAYPDSGAKKFLWGGKSAVMGEAPKLMPYRFDADRYDTVIIGTPVWAGTFAPPIRTFINENKDKLAGKNIAVFVCLSGSGAEKTIAKLKNYLGIEKFAAELILIDPKDKPSDENENKINGFCSALK